MIRPDAIPLTQIASVIRSKNAGPYHLTFDIIFRTELDYCHVRDVGLFTPDLFARLYNIDVADVVGVVYFDPARAVKATIKRPIPAGGPGDSDVYGAQQHAPLLGLEVPARGETEGHP